MIRVPTVKPKDIIRYLKYLRFEQIRQKGSHIFFKHSDGRTATVPYHKGEDLGRGITNKILKDIESTQVDFANWCNKRR